MKPSRKRKRNSCKEKGNLIDLFEKLNALNKKKLENDDDSTVNSKISEDNTDNSSAKLIDKTIIENEDTQNDSVLCKEDCKICKLESYVSNDWYTYLCEEFSKDYFISIKTELHKKAFYPPIEKIFLFSKYFDIKDTKVVIIGQDPYHNPNQAMGLSFSVPINVKIPPSLKNIYKELNSDLTGYSIPSHGSLIKWAEQGVLLLNDVLTVEKNKPGSHSKMGWKLFTQRILEVINETCNNVVFLLWGNYARSKSFLINPSKHLILESAHPSPFSANKFFGCKHFSKTNEYLKNHNKVPIDWAIL
ncbi:hypothetical protein WA026_010651 [Henosepilachna vigintioctopunctata]|uniref:Uracil-DNA glycosylase n=1 Tax=Henosepilachna vigintioctopunctata TaxID=420089 RepID=A0AAW1UYU1_9CUCU